MSDEVHVTDALRRAGLRPLEAILWAGEEWLVGALVAPGHLVLGWIDVAWDGPSDPRPVLQDPVHLPGWASHELGPAITRVRALGQAARKPCRFCGERFAPGSLDSGACHACASDHLGVIY